MSDDYEIGYARPPEHGQFQTGVSGNPNGRPKGSKNRKTIFKKVFLTDEVFNINNIPTTVSGLELIYMKLKELAAKGNLPAIIYTISLNTQLENHEINEARKKGIKIDEDNVEL